MKVKDLKWMLDSNDQPSNTVVYENDFGVFQINNKGNSSYCLLIITKSNKRIKCNNSLKGIENILNHF